MLNDLKKLYKNKDFEALDKLAIPTFRVLNKINDFSKVSIVDCNNIEMLNSIDDMDAQCIMLDLTSSNRENRHLGLVICAIYLTRRKEYSKKLIVLINSLNDSGYEEITYLNQFMPDSIVVSSIKNKKEVKNVLALLNEDIELHLNIQTSESWHNLSTLRCELRVSTFYLDIINLLRNMQLTNSIIDLQNPTMRYMLSHFLVTCKAMGVKPVSFACENSKELSSWLKLEESMGYDAKLFSNSVV